MPGGSTPPGMVCDPLGHAELGMGFLGSARKSSKISWEAEGSQFPPSFARAIWLQQFLVKMGTRSRRQGHMPKVTNMETVQDSFYSTVVGELCEITGFSRSSLKTCHRAGKGGKGGQDPGILPWLQLKQLPLPMCFTCQASAEGSF